MAKGCAIFFGLAFLGLAIFCGGVGWLVKQQRDQQRAVEAAMTPQQKEALAKQRADQAAQIEREGREYSARKSQERLVQSLVTDNLKAPSTAKFNLESGYNKDNADELIVQGYVDSQNGFGAMIRAKIYALSIGREKPDLKFLQLDDKILLDQISNRP